MNDSWLARSVAQFIANVLSMKYIDESERYF